MSNTNRRRIIVFFFADVLKCFDKSEELKLAKKMKLPKNTNNRFLSKTFFV